MPWPSWRRRVAQREVQRVLLSLADRLTDWLTDLTVTRLPPPQPAPLARSRAIGGNGLLAKKKDEFLARKNLVAHTKYVHTYKCSRSAAAEVAAADGPYAPSEHPGQCFVPRRLPTPHNEDSLFSNRYRYQLQPHSGRSPNTRLHGSLCSAGDLRWSRQPTAFTIRVGLAAFNYDAEVWAGEARCGVRGGRSTGGG